MENTYLRKCKEDRMAEREKERKEEKENQQAQIEFSQGIIQGTHKKGNTHLKSENRTRK